MAVNLDRGLNDLEDSIDRLIKQKEYNLGDKGYIRPDVRQET